MPEEITYTERFVARADSAPRMARAFVAERFRLRTVWLLLTLVLALFALVFLSGMDPAFSLRVRVFWAVVFAVVPLLLVVLGFAVLVHVLTLRGARVRLFEGAVLETGFGAEELLLRGPMAESRIRYAAIRSLTARGDHVFMRQHGVPVVSVFPRSLFPDEAIARINAAARR